MVDFVALANTAQRLVQNTPGRNVTFIELDSTAVDVNKPWRGTATPRVTPKASSAQVAVFVPASGSGLGFRSSQDELVKRSEQIMLVAPGAANTDDLQQFDEVIDQDGSRWKIVFADVLSPADVPVLYAVGVRR